MKISGHTSVVMTEKLLSRAKFSNLTQSAVIMISQRLCLGIILSGFITGQASAAEPKQSVVPLNSIVSVNSIVSINSIVPIKSAVPISPVLAANYNKTQIQVTPVHSPVPKLSTKLSTKRANFKQETTTQDSVYIADWVLDSGDNQQMPFAIVDKKAAKVYVFDARGQLTGAAPALLGLAVGDDSIPNIGNMALASIKPEQRTTPAGRFVVSLGKNIHNKEILWVDYDTAISLHSVVTSSPKERRLQRLASQNPLERRISYGCINVPVNFYDQVVSPAFTGTNGVVYVLPDTRSIQEVFGSYSVADRTLQQ